MYVTLQHFVKKLRISLGNLRQEEHRDSYEDTDEDNSEIEAAAEQVESVFSIFLVACSHLRLYILIIFALGLKMLKLH